MDMHTACEQAYKNGYEKGMEDMQKTCDELQRQVDLKQLQMDCLKSQLSMRQSDVDKYKGHYAAYLQLLAMIERALGAEKIEKLLKDLVQKETNDA